MPSRRDLIRMTSEEIDTFLHERRTMNIATVNHDNTIHMVAMWYGFLDGCPAFWTYGKSQKIKNLERDPRITCMVEEGDAYEKLRGVELVGRGEVVRDRDQVLEVGRSVQRRYFGELPEGANEGFERMGAKRLAVKVHVERTVSWDHSKLGGQY